MSVVLFNPSEYEEITRNIGSSHLGKGVSYDDLSKWEILNPNSSDKEGANRYWFKQNYIKSNKISDKTIIYH